MQVAKPEARGLASARGARTYRGVKLQRPAAPPQTPLAVLEEAVRRAIQKNLAMLRASGAAR